MADSVSKNGVYSRLREDQVRLMRLKHPQSSLIECELETFSINHMPKYTALSYCWTQANAEFEIHLDGQTFWVRPNLHAYLKIMSDESHSCWIFIDALSINQADLIERSNQAKLMGQIYRRAEEVIAWLNSPQSGFVEAFIALTKPECDSAWTRQSMETYVQATCDSEAELCAVLAKERGPAMRTILLAAAITWFIRTEYWTRVWIVQETLLARVLRIRAHWLSISSKQLYLLMRHLPGSVKRDTTYTTSYWRSLVWRKNAAEAENTDEIVQHIHVASQLMEARHGVETTVETVNQKPISEALLTYSSQRCSETFDKVFGLLGLVASQIQPNYDMSRIELLLRVFIETIVEQNRHHKLLDVTEATKDVSTSSPVHEKKLLGAQLLHHLHLDPSDQVVTLVTQAALEACGKRFENSEIDVFSIVLLSTAPYFGESTRIRSPLGTVWSLLRLVVHSIWIGYLAWRLAKNLHHNNVLTSTYESGGRTARAWAEMASDMVSEIADGGEAILKRQSMAKRHEFEAEASIGVKALESNSAEGSANIREALSRLFDNFKKFEELLIVDSAGNQLIDRGALYMWQIKKYEDLVLQFRVMNAQAQETESR